MAPNCLSLDNQSETIFSPKNGIRKQILREDEKRHQEETEDWQRRIFSILDPRHSEQASDVTKFKVPDFRDVSVTLTAPHRHSSSLDILSSSVCQEIKHCLFVCYSLSHERVSIKTIFLLLLNNRFSLFFELLNNLATYITWPLEDPAELCQPTFVDLSNTAWVRNNLTKQTVGS